MWGVAAASAIGQTRTFDGGGDGVHWTDPANWDPGDVPDVPVMRSVALAAAPADAATDARETAHWVLRTAGGHGVVREVIERLMRAQGNWNASDG